MLTTYICEVLCAKWWRMDGHLRLYIHRWWRWWQNEKRIHGGRAPCLFLSSSLFLNQTSRQRPVDNMQYAT